MITNQEIFDKAWQAFVVEQRPASVCYDSDGDLDSCLYRDPNGNRCAIGLCIPDDQYDPGIERRCPHDLHYDFDIEFEDVEFAKTAQEALHDCITEQLGKPEEAEFVRERYLEFARDWDLEVPEEAT